MTKAVKLMIVLQVSKNLVLAINNIVGIQISVILLRRTDNINRPVCNFLKLRIRILCQGISNRFNPF